MVFQIKVNGTWTTLPEPAQGGLAITREPIWSSNTGRAQNGKLTGDIVDTKTTIEVTWPPLSHQTTNALITAIENAGAFFQVRFTSDLQANNSFSNTTYQTYTVYASSLPRTVYSMADKFRRHNGVTVTFIEQ